MKSSPKYKWDQTDINIYIYISLYLEFLVETLIDSTVITY